MALANSASVVRAEGGESGFCFYPLPDRPIRIVLAVYSLKREMGGKAVIIMLIFSK